MKRTISFLLCFFVIPVQGFGASIALSTAHIIGNSVSSLSSWCTHKTARAALAVGTAVGMVALHKKLMNLVKKEFERYKKQAQEDPVPDCPIKKKISAKFAEHGYEVFFVRQRAGSTDNAAVLSYGQKVIFLVFEDGTHSFFNDPKLDAARDGIIEHELAHVLHGDTARMMRYLSCAIPLALSTAVYTGMEVALCDINTLMTSLGHVSSIPNGIDSFSGKIGTIYQKAYNKIADQIPHPVTSFASCINEKISEKFKTCGYILTKKATCLCNGLIRTGVGTVATTTTAQATLGSAVLGKALLSRYQEKCADYAAIKRGDPAMLEGMADFFKRMGRGTTPHTQKTWKRWWWDNFIMTHPCCHERCKYLQYEAAKLRKKGK